MDIDNIKAKDFYQYSSVNIVADGIYKDYIKIGPNRIWNSGF